MCFSAVMQHMSLWCCLLHKIILSQRNPYWSRISVCISRKKSCLRVRISPCIILWHIICSCCTWRIIIQCICSPCHGVHIVISSRAACLFKPYTFCYCIIAYLVFLYIKTDLYRIAFWWSFSCKFSIFIYRNTYILIIIFSVQLKACAFRSIVFI